MQGKLCCKLHKTSKCKCHIVWSEQVIVTHVAALLSSCFLSSCELRQLDSNTSGSRLQFALSVCVILRVGL